MFRTRDFVLLFTVIVFLVLAVGVSVLDMFMPIRSLPTVFVPAEPVTESGAEVVLVTEDRERRAAALADKIAQGKSTYLTAPVPVSAVTPAAEEVPDTATIEPLWCGSYQPYRGAWPRQVVVGAVAEGVRPYYDPLFTGQSSTTPLLPLLALPLSPVPSIPYCLPTDVVGIATDGSLIRNNEAQVYSIFGADTLVGYALDGFPIYGLATTFGDECGGVAHVSGYRYQLSAERPYILGCFSALPAPLP